MGNLAQLYNPYKVCLHYIEAGCSYCVGNSLRQKIP